MKVVSGSSVRIAADVVFEGGANGWGAGAAALLEVDAAFSATTLGFNLPALVPALSQVAIATTLTLTYTGEPGDTIIPMYAPQLAPGLALSGIEGLLHLDLFSIAVLPPVSLSGMGFGSTTAAVPALPALAGAHIWAQAAELAAGAVWLSNPTRVEIAL